MFQSSTSLSRRTANAALATISRTSALAVLVLASLGTAGCNSDPGPRKDPIDAPKKSGAPLEPTALVAGKSQTIVDASGFEWTLPAGLSAAPKVPADNPMSKEKVALGHALFMDKRLSVDGGRSCYSCHQNELGGADGRPKALGAQDKPLPRNTPTIWNVGYRASWYWDGRAETLEGQMLGAWKGGNMGVGEDGIAAKAAEIGQLAEYRAQFQSVFGLGEQDPVTPQHVAMAISAYERTLNCGDTAFDLATASEQARRGWDIFRGKAQCVSCHFEEHFSDGMFHNVGVGSVLKPDETPDLGRGKVTGDAADNGKFRTPSLRGVSQTAPYFHDGSVATLREAVVLMAAGGVADAPGRDPLLSDKALTDAEIDDVTVFLESLACPGKLDVIGDQNLVGINSPLPTAVDKPAGATGDGAEPKDASAPTVPPEPPATP